MRKSFMELKSKMELKTSTDTERLMLHERNYSESENTECMKQFNPITRESYEFMTETWKNVNIFFFNLIIKFF